MIGRWLKKLIAYFNAPEPWYAIKHRTRGWVSGNSPCPIYRLHFAHALWFDEPDEAVLALHCGGCAREDHTLVRIDARAGSGDYTLTEVPW